MSTRIASAAGEPVGTRLRPIRQPARSFEIAPEEVPLVIDEIPALAALAAMMPPGLDDRTRRVRTAREGKRSHLDARARASARSAPRSRNTTTASRSPAARSRGGAADAAGDHRLAMAFAIAAPARAAPATITGARSVAVSYPGFFDELDTALAAGDAPDKIYLVGFMAAGKTTVARALAARLGWRAEDIDELIEARERRTVADIFARHGEPYFRARRARDPPPAAAAAPRGRRDRRRDVHGSRQRGGDQPRRHVGVARRAASTSCSRACPPTAAGRSPPTARRWSGCSHCARPPTPARTCAIDAACAPRRRDRRAHPRARR